MKPITEWYRAVPDPDMEDFNHIEDGHVPLTRPTPKTPEQVGPWSRGKWYGYHAWLTDDVPPKVVHYGPDEE